MLLDLYPVEYQTNVAYSRTATETVGAAADSVSRALVLTRQQSETVAEGDAVSRVLALARAASESLAPGDQVARSYVGARAPSEAVFAADSVSRAGSGFSRARTLALSINHCPGVCA